MTGAAGAIGQALVRTLLRQGYRVGALVRKEGDERLLPGDVEIIRGDITDRNALLRGADGVDCVFHLAAKPHRDLPGSALHSEYVRVNVEGSRQLARALKEARVGRLVFFSTINVYGTGPTSGLYTEESPLSPISWYAETKAEAERVLLSESPAVVLRLGAVYGPCMRNNYMRLLFALRKRMFVPIGPGRNRRTLVYVADACEAALLVARHSDAQGQVFNVTDGGVHSFQEIIHAMSLALGRRAPALHVPVGAARLAAMGVDAVTSVLGRGEMSASYAINKIIEDLAVSGAKLGRLGFRPKFDLHRGWEETVRAQLLAKDRTGNVVEG